MLSWIQEDLGRQRQKPY